MELMSNGYPMLNVRGAPKYIVEWLEVLGEGDEAQVGYIRKGCGSLDEVRTEILAGWGDEYLTSVCVLVRNEAGTYDFMEKAELKSLVPASPIA